MIKKALLASALAVTLSPVPVVAEHLHALSVLQATPDPMKDKDRELATTVEGATCDSSSADSAGGISLCAGLEPGASSGTAHFTGANELPVTRARFLQVVY